MDQPQTTSEKQEALESTYVNHYYCPGIPKIRKYIKKLQAGKTPEELGLNPKLLSKLRVKQVEIKHGSKV